MEQTRVIMLMMALALAVLSFAATSKSAAARSRPAVDPTWTTWAFDLTPLNDEYDARWTIKIGGEDKSGNPVTLHEETMRLDCLPVGDVKIDGPTIHFDGGHLECRFPDLIATANEIIVEEWGKQYVLNIGSDCGCMPIREAFAEAVALPAGPDNNPVFDHPSIRFDLNVDKAGVANKFFFSADESAGRPIPASNLETYRSTYGCDAKLGSCRYKHYRGNRLTAEDKHQYKVTTFYTGSVAVHIGSSIQGSDTFYGSLASLSVDPGCRAH